MTTIDRGGYKRKATDSSKRVHDESPRQAVVNNSRGRSTQARQRIDTRSTEEYKRSGGEATVP
jgi:hypothetical protein